ncbi:MAG: hypothetical protein K8S22_05670 [Betaproteobacteria bacterium]|nr:hypothetical protein [Betaproteobacteria bacterium]
MKPLFTGITLAAWMVALPAPVFAADSSAGQQDYEIRCAMCHGGGGKGDGWLAAQLIQRVPPLTQMKKSNGGVFPTSPMHRVRGGCTWARRSCGPGYWR